MTPDELDRILERVARRRAARETGITILTLLVLVAFIWILWSVGQ